MMNEPQPTGPRETADLSQALTVIDVLDADSAAPNPDRPRGVVKRLFSGDGANVITFTFAAGQSWPDHQAAHPILVQCLAGKLEFSVGDERVRLDPGVVVHLSERVLHRVDCPEDAPEANVLLLTMLTGESPQPG